MRVLRSRLMAWGLLILAGCTSAKQDADDPKAPVAPLTEEARHGLTAAQASQVLFEVGDKRITLGAFADRLHEQSPYLRARYVSPE